MTEKQEKDKNLYWFKSDFCVPRNRIKTCGVFGCPFL